MTGPPLADFAEHVAEAAHASRGEAGGKLVMASKTDTLVALRTALRDEARTRLETETARLRQDLAVREAELAEARKRLRKP